MARKSEEEIQIKLESHKKQYREWKRLYEDAANYQQYDVAQKAFVNMKKEESAVDVLTWVLGN